MVVDGRYRVRAVDRALDLLELLGAAGPDGGTVSELARRAGVSKASAYATLQTLLARGFVADRDSGPSRRYRLGMELARLGDRAASQSSIADVALPLLRRLTDATGRPARLAVLDDGAAVVIGRVDAPGIVQFRAHLGRREHGHTSGVGKALLATLPDDQVAMIAALTKLPRRTARSIIPSMPCSPTWPASGSEAGRSTTKRMPTASCASVRACMGLAVAASGRSASRA